MGYFANLFVKASEIGRLRDERDYLQQCLNREIATNVLLQHQIIDERKAKDRFVNRFCNQLSVKAGLIGVFTKDEPKQPKLPEVYSPEVENKITAAAEMQRNADIDAGFDPQPIEFYAGQIREDPEKWLPH